MSVSLTHKMIHNLRETRTLSGASDDRFDVLYDQFNVDKVLDADSTPAITKGFADTLTLSTGTLTLDLTSLADGDFATKTFNGLKLVTLHVKNPSTNANDITLAEGASNGYPLFGAGWTITLRPGEAFSWESAGDAPAVGSGDKEIDISGTGSQEVQISMTAGA